MSQLDVLSIIVLDSEIAQGTYLLIWMTSRSVVLIRPITTKICTTRIYEILPLLAPAQNHFICERDWDASLLGYLISRIQIIKPDQAKIKLFFYPSISCDPTSLRIALGLHSHYSTRVPHGTRTKYSHSSQAILSHYLKPLSRRWNLFGNVVRVVYS